MAVAIKRGRVSIKFVNTQRAQWTPTIPTEGSLASLDV